MSNNPFVSAVTLDDALASLQPLSHEHLQDLQAATDDGDLDKLWFTTVPTALGMSDEIQCGQYGV